MYNKDLVNYFKHSCKFFPKSATMHWHAYAGLLFIALKTWQLPCHIFELQ